MMQDNLFEDLEKDWEADWHGMPEYVVDKEENYATIIVRFETKSDLEEFEKLIGQPLNKKTKSIWHPKLVRGQHSNKRYVDE